MDKIRKAIIPAAGLGTRFLPATKTIPKEMLPLVDKPSLLYIVEEAVDAGIEDIVIVAGRNKNSIEDFFDCSYELEDTLQKADKTDLLESITRVKNLANIISIRQQQAKGLGHAVHVGKPIIGDAPFAVLLGDEIMSGEPSILKEICATSEESDISTVALMEVAKKDVIKYGIVDVAPINERLYKIKNVVEKPSVEQAPSQLMLPGRYVFNHEILTALENTKPGRNGEIQLTDAMATLAQKGKMQGLTLKCTRYDAGDKLGFLIANVELALHHPELKDEFKTYLQNLVKEMP